MNPYQECPEFETEHLFIRLIRREDAEDLLNCYSDRKAQELFNADNCTGDFRMYKLDDMSACIEAWLSAYENGEFIRFTIVDKALDKAIGTIEMFGGDVGVLRLDVTSTYEEKVYLSEIIDVCLKNFFAIFETNEIVTKAIEKAQLRREVLLEAGFIAKKFKGREDYLCLTNKKNYSINLSAGEIHPVN